MDTLDLNRPLFSLTVGEFLALKNTETIKQPTNTNPEKKYVYGLQGLARLLGCSHPTAQRVKDSGKIPFTQTGRKLIFDQEAVLSALAEKGDVSA